MKKIEISKEIQFNLKEEASAIEYYTNLMNDILECEELTEEDKNDLISNIAEIVSDELNHQEKLQAIYVALTGIEPAKE